MKEINEENLDTAIALGDAVCNELGICCEKRGRVIFQVYKKLEELKPQEAATGSPEATGAQADLDRMLIPGLKAGEAETEAKGEDVGSRL